MAHTHDPQLLDRVKQYGAFDINACFNCGNCTAVCPLSDGQANFPRRLIRYGQVGMEDQLLADKDLWMCYYCGQCSETCPRQAQPGEYMASVRRYAISRYDPTGISRLLYSSVIGHIVIFLAFTAFFTLFLLSQAGQRDLQELQLFHFLPYQLIHWIGIGLFVIIGLSFLGGIVSVIKRFTRVRQQNDSTTPLAMAAIPAAAIWAIKESLGQFRYRDCDADKNEYPLPLKPWFVHASILWGFLAMLLATTLAFITIDAGYREPGQLVAMWTPSRLLGIFGGLFCLYGCAVTIYRRITQPTAYYAHGRFSDWFFLLLLTVTVLTGFATIIAMYFPAIVTTSWGYGLFLTHIVLAMDLLIMMPLTKFAHATYRPLALFLHRWANAPAPVPAAAKA